MRASGLLTERGERFAGMVVVPDLAWGRVGWLVGRTIEPDVTPRFQALPGPRPPVLGLGWIDQATPYVVLAEGLFDWLALVQWGLPGVAALGTQGLERVALALRGCARVFLAFDSDDAGREAAERLAGLLGRRAAVVGLPPIRAKAEPSSCTCLGGRPAPSGSGLSPYGSRPAAPSRPSHFPAGSGPLPPTQHPFSSPHLGGAMPNSSTGPASPTGFR